MFYKYIKKMSDNQSNTNVCMHLPSVLKILVSSSKISEKKIQVLPEAANISKALLSLIYNLKQDRISTYPKTHQDCNKGENCIHVIAFSILKFCEMIRLNISEMIAGCMFYHEKEEIKKIEKSVLNMFAEDQALGEEVKQFIQNLSTIKITPNNSEYYVNYYYLLSGTMERQYLPLIGRDIVEISTSLTYPYLSTKPNSPNKGGYVVFYHNQSATKTQTPTASSSSTMVNHISHTIWTPSAGIPVSQILGNGIQASHANVLPKTNIDYQRECEEAERKKRELQEKFSKAQELLTQKKRYLEAKSEMEKLETHYAEILRQLESD